MDLAGQKMSSPSTDGRDVPRNAIEGVVHQVHLPSVACTLHRTVTELSRCA